jgi:hypothetical protein
MACPKKNKNCQSTLLIKGKEDNFICAGISTKPTNYKKDNIWLCSKGAVCQFALELTVEEALYICSALNSALGWLAPGIIHKEIKKRNKK